MTEGRELIVGILSDSHGRHQAVRAAMRLFDSLGTAHVIHCGDVGGTEVFDELAGCPCTFVWGNMDFPDAGLERHLQAVGLRPASSVPALITLASKTIAVFHGHESAFQNGRFDRLGVDYVLHGHTHIARDERAGAVRIINPGALHRAHPRTVATLDIKRDELAFHLIET